MHTVEFLRRMFPLEGPNDPRANDIVRFIVVGPNQPWPGIHHFRTKGELHALDATGINALGFQTTGYDVYFTPHGFTARHERLDKSDAAALVDVAWVECDDDDIPPETFTPRPSLAVETSPGRYHLYWLLTEPVSSADIERINYRLTYGNNLKQDKSGWALTKLLRLPGSTSYKREQPFPIQVKIDHRERVFRIADFGDLPEAPAVLVANTQKPVPELKALRGRDAIEKDFALPLELVDLLDRPRSDRSTALWRVYNLCYRLSIPEEDCFALVRKSANDKFTDWRYNGESGLWKDILRGYHMAHTPEDTPVLAELRATRAKGLPKPERRREMAEVIIKDLAVRGRVYVDDARRDALYYDGKTITPIDSKDRRWKTLLNLRYHIAEGDEDFTAVNANLYAMAMDTGERVTPRTFSFWDRDRKLLYIYNNAGRVFRLDGARIESLENGVDGILFRETDDAESFQPELPGDNAPTLESAILGLPNYVDDPAVHTREQAVMLARIWLYSIFFAEHLEARPHLVFVGPTASGKSTIFDLFCKLLIGGLEAVQALPNDRNGFENIISNRHHVFFDNVDDKGGRRWLMDALAEVATGIQFNRRVLYSTNETITYRVQCALGLTTRDPWFSRTDIANRIIPIQVERRDYMKNIADLRDVVRAYRGVLWTELLDDLNRIVAVLQRHVPREHTLRMAGYADFIDAVCQAFAIAPGPIMAVIAGQQVTSALDHSIIWQLLDVWLHEADRADPTKLKNNGQWISTSRLHTELRRVAERTGDERAYGYAVANARALSHQLIELKKDLAAVVEVQFQKRNPVNEYAFTLKDAA